MPFQSRDLLRSGLVVAMAAAVLNLATVGFAAPPAPPGVPEIDPSSAASALAVLAGSGLILAERLGLRRK